MADINCPKCGMSVKEYREVCPSCGTRIQHLGFGSPLKVALSVGGVSLLILLGWMLIRGLF